MCRAHPDAIGRAGVEAQNGLKLDVALAALLRPHNMRLRSNIRELNLSSVQAISL